MFIVVLVILFFPVPDFSVQIAYGSNYPREPLFLTFVPHCGKGNIVCEPFHKIWQVFYYLYN